MIYTLTLNPALDYDLYLDKLIEGGPQTAKKTNLRAGGKGLTVSKMLKKLNKDSIALGYAGGFAGDFIERNLKDEQITSKFIHLQDATRINVILKNNKVETEIAGVTPKIERREINDLFEIIKSKIKKDDIFVMAGSIPCSMSPKTYFEIVDALPKGTKTILDTRGSFLKANVNKNFLIKPNLRELEDMFGEKFKSTKEIITACKYFLDKGVENIVVSMDAKGALLITKDKCYKATPAKGELLNSVGAGDSLVAGFVCGVFDGLSIKEAFKLGVASGTATAYSYKLSEKNLVDAILQSTKVETLS